MEGDDELREVDIKSRTCYYFDNITKNEDFHFDDILLDKKLQKILIGAKPLHIRSDKADAFMRVYDGTRYLALFALKKMMPFKIRLDIL